MYIVYNAGNARTYPIPAINDILSSDKSECIDIVKSIKAIPNSGDSIGFSIIVSCVYGYCFTPV